MTREKLIDLLEGAKTQMKEDGKKLVLNERTVTDILNFLKRDQNDTYHGTVIQMNHDICQKAIQEIREDITESKRTGMTKENIYWKMNGIIHGIRICGYTVGYKEDLRRYGMREIQAQLGSFEVEREK